MALAGLLDKIERRAMEPLLAFTHGVVLAVKFQEEDIASLRRNQAAGVMAFDPVPPSRIVDRAIIPPENVHDSFTFEDVWELPAYRVLVPRIATVTAGAS